MSRFLVTIKPLASESFKVPNVINHTVTDGLLVLTCEEAGSPMVVGLHFVAANLLWFRIELQTPPAP